MARFIAKGLDRVGVAARKIPEVARSVVGDFGLALWIDHGHLAIPGEDVGPFRRVVPMHLPHAAGIEIKMRAGDVGRNGKAFGGDIARPAARGRLDRALVECGREGDGIAGPAWDYRKEFGRSGDIVARGVSVTAHGMRAGRGETAGGKGKTS